MRYVVGRRRDRLRRVFEVVNGELTFASCQLRSGNKVAYETHAGQEGVHWPYGEGPDKVAYKTKNTGKADYAIYVVQLK